MTVIHLSKVEMEKIIMSIIVNEIRLYEDRLLSLFLVFLKCQSWKD